MNDKPKSKWYWRLLRWGLIGLAVLATLVAVLVTEENWRGKRAWETYKHAAEARGERFDWSALTPAGIPDDQNFAKAPIFSALTTMIWDEQAQEWKPSDTNAMNRLKMSAYRADGSSPKGKGGSWEQARLSQLDKWQEYYRASTTNGISEFPLAPQPQTPAADVLLALSKYDSAIEELHRDTHRPYFRRGGYSFNDRDFSLGLVWFSRFKGFAQVLQLRAIAELENNQSNQALEDVQCLLRLEDELRQEPLLIAHLVSIAISSIALQPVYEGLAQHRWSDAQLVELEKSLAAKDFLADYQYAMRGERIFAVDMLENERISGEYKTYDVVDGKTKVVSVNMSLMPSAYFYQNELACAQLNEELLLPLADVTNRLVSPAAVRQTTNLVQEQLKHFSLYRMQAQGSLAAVMKSVFRFALIQAGTDQARLACALERYRLAHHEYPATLDILAPHFIAQVPHDLINGQPLHYRRTDDGKFVLYSVGWNETDDNGTVALTKTGTLDREKGDWVWKY